MRNAPKSLSPKFQVEICPCPPDAVHHACCAKQGIVSDTPPKRGFCPKIASTNATKSWYVAPIRRSPLIFNEACSSSALHSSHQSARYSAAPCAGLVMQCCGVVGKL